jgi:hypothetical protein
MTVGTIFNKPSVFCWEPEFSTMRFQPHDAGPLGSAHAKFQSSIHGVHSTQIHTYHELANTIENDEHSKNAHN